MKYFFVFFIFISCKSINTETDKNLRNTDNQIVNTRIKSKQIDSNSESTERIVKLDSIETFKGSEIPKEVVNKLFSTVIFPDYFSVIVLDSVKKEVGYKTLFMTIECLTGETCIEHRMITVNDTEVIDSEMLYGSFIGGFESDEFVSEIWNDTIIRKHSSFKFNEEGDTNSMKTDTVIIIVNSKGEILKLE